MILCMIRSSCYKKIPFLRHFSCQDQTQTTKLKQSEEAFILFRRITFDSLTHMALLMLIITREIHLHERKLLHKELLLKE
jgi:hypothetical protein